MILAEKLLRLRKKSGMSQEELAEKMKVSRQAVSKWEGAQSVPDLEKLLQLSELFGVTTDYLLKDDIEDEEFTGKDYPEAVRKVTMEQANEYLALRKTASVRVAVAVFLCILSVIPLIVLAGVAEFSGLPVSENVAAAAGTIIMLILVAVAVALFIYTGAQSKPYEFLEKDPFETEYGVEGMVRERQRAFRNAAVKCRIIGASLCVLSPAALFIAAAADDEFLAVIMTAVTIAIAGLGAMFFIVAGVREASMEKLLQEGEYAPNAKHSMARKIAPIYWCSATAIYLAWLFLAENGKYDAWQDNRSWIVWPVAGVLFVAVIGICRLIEQRKEEQDR